MDQGRHEKRKEKVGCKKMGEEVQVEVGYHVSPKNRKKSRSQNDVSEFIRTHKHSFLTIHFPRREREREAGKRKTKIETTERNRSARRSRET